MIEQILRGLDGEGVEAALAGVDVAEIPQVRTVVATLAVVEQQNLAATAELLDSLGAEQDVDVPDVETRQVELLSAVDAATSGRFDEWWLETVAAEWLDSVDQATDVVGIGSDSEAWAARKQAWRDSHVEQGTAETDTSVETVTERHVRDEFGVSLERFEADIVDWDEQAELQRVLIGPLQRNAATVGRVADHLDDD